MNKDRIVGIEFLRFLSSLSILVWHFQHFSSVDFEKNTQPFYSFLNFFYEHGSVGVKVFWCISGVVFFYIYLEKILNNQLSFINFSIARFSRLYPLHFLTLIIILLLQIIYEYYYGSSFKYIYDVKHFFLNIFFLNGWGIEDGFSFNGPSWSVSIEILIYIIFFMLFFYLKIYLSFIISIILFLLFYFTSLANGNVAYALFYFFVGGLLSISKYHPDKIFSNKLTRKYFFYILGIILLMGMMFVLKNNLLYEKFFIHLFVVSLVYFFILINKIFKYNKEIWIFLGNLTYSSYLIHFPLQLLLMIFSKIFEIDLDIESTSLFLFYILTTLILSFFVYKKYEMPMQKYIRLKYIK